MTEQQFGNIVIKNSNGTVLHLKRYSSYRCGAQKGTILSLSLHIANQMLHLVRFYLFEHRPSAGFAISLQNDANALETISNVQKILQEQSKSFPQDLEYHEVVDNTKFVRASINEVEHTFFEALLLVLIVVYVFLQSWRSTLIPMIAVPVSLLGTFGALYY